ncbi:54S ribosomal protein-like protein [Emericellopsis cladophorae]|uniref:Large ribosomal subunit protein mL46 n=1 Tax=Emericellopsis cladophorae TaxID=2686198 RepID=A0A9P9Y244_9HYPO|nr:54S ribosomal protein-like protein [Emericellopsis cladophorae]KAI6782203.1 54S ribosomal protein-like protein [Emericellopsis cladophorae]
MLRLEKKFRRDGGSSPNVCTRCATTRFYSAPAAATSPAEPTIPQSTQVPPPPSPAVTSPGAYDVRSGLILTRAPLLTRKLHPFENTFFFYQKRLEERLNSAFIPSIYFRPDTPRRMEWDLKIKEREGTVAKELGAYKGKGADAWQDELRVGDELSSESHMIKSLLKDAETRISEDAEIIPEADVTPVTLPNGRETEADKKGDVKRLDRALDRTLYLVVKGKDGWGFPADVVPEGENLHTNAQRVLDQAAGVNMNTWIVGRVPVAHVVRQPVTKADGSVESKGQKTFLLKGRIMAGQADLKGNPLGYTDFKWLTREEVEKELPAGYLKGIRNMMGER